jgi:hypothetical protein
MKRIALFAFALSLLLSPHMIHAQATGEKLLQECQLVIKYPDASKMTDDESGKAIHCLGYLRGAMDVYGEWDEFNTKRHGNNPSPVCLPINVTTNEIVMVVVKYLNDYPNKLHEDRSLLVLFALSDAYPCK